MLTKLEENVMLVVLQLRDDAYIVAIKDQLEKLTQKTISFGALYVSLNRLIKYEYLESNIGESKAVRGGRAKKYYRITKPGIAALRGAKEIQKVMWRDFNALAKEILEGE